MRTRKSAEPSMAVRVTERLMDQAKTGIEVDTGHSFWNDDRDHHEHDY